MERAEKERADRLQSIAAEIQQAEAETEAQKEALRAGVLSAKKAHEKVLLPLKTMEEGLTARLQTLRAEIALAEKRFADLRASASELASTLTR